MHPSSRSLLSSCVALSACTSLSYRGCRPGEQFAIQDSLYFGTGKRDGAIYIDLGTDDGRTVEVTAQERPIAGDDNGRSSQFPLELHPIIDTVSLTTSSMLPT